MSSLATAMFEVGRRHVYLDTLHLTNFRSCEALAIKFQQDLTVLVGENNAGKSNVIDAVRLLTTPLNGRRDRYAEDDDIRKGSFESKFSITAEFRGLSDTLKALLITAVPDPRDDLAILGMQYEKGRPRGQVTFWAGRFSSAEPEPGSRELIRHVYLPPLRDAHRALGSSNPTRIAALLRHFLGDTGQDEFLKTVRRNPKAQAALTPINEEIRGALRTLTEGVRRQTAELGFADEDLWAVARDLRFKLSDAGFDPDDIRASGLGYANLLYLATVIVELNKAQEADLTLFLVEEPEAHLHPQLQMVVLDYLLRAAQESANRSLAPGEPEGRIQVVVTTHSPNLAAGVSANHLVVLRSARTDHPKQSLRTASVSIGSLGLPRATLNKVDRYLDVTRSALLFGNRAILLEGIAEALLLPAIARHLVLDEEAWQRFRGVLLLPIGGVDFAPYVQLLLRSQDGVRIMDRLVVVTDADPRVPGNRKKALQRLARQIGAEDALKVIVNRDTLEYELFHAGNEQLLKEAVLAMHPEMQRTWRAFIEEVSEEERPSRFVEFVVKKRIRKGDLSQELASRIVQGAQFKVPGYLRDAIQAVVSDGW